MSDDDKDQIYEAEVQGSAAGLSEYKFNRDCTGPGYETIPDSTFEVTGTEIDTDENGFGEIVIDRAFDNLGLDDVLSEEVAVIFSVDCTPLIQALEEGNTIDPVGGRGQAIDSLEALTRIGLNGPWLDWNWGNFTPEQLLTDDGLGADNIYSGIIDFPAGTPKQTLFKYSANASDNEAGFEQDRALSLDSDPGIITLETACFGSQNEDPAQPFGNVEGAFTCVAEHGFIRADGNSDGEVNLAVGVFVLNCLFLGGEPPTCRDAADTGNAGDINITSAVALFNFLFLGGAPPPPPTGVCGPDPEGGDLGCEQYAHCP